MLVAVAERGGWNFGIPTCRILRGWNGVGKGLEQQEQLREVGGLILEKRRLRDLLSLHNFLTGGWGQVGIGLCSQGTSSRKRGNNLKLHQGRFGLDISKNFFTGRVVTHWNRLPWAVVESSSLEMFKRHGYDTWGHGLVLNMVVPG